MYGLDVLNSTLQEIKPGWQDFFTMNHPLLHRLLEKNINSEELQGLFVEFPVLTGGPGEGLTIRTGSEPIQSQRQSRLRKGREDAAYIMYHFVVPMKDIKDADHPMDFAKLVDNYAEPAFAESNEMIAEQMVRGAATAGTSDFGGGFDGIVTLNGNSTYNPQGTARTGIFQFATQANQTGTVHSLPLHSATTNATRNWYNQYTHVNSFSQTGRFDLRRVIDRCNQQGGKLSGNVDLLLSDDLSYQHYAESLDNQVVVASVLEGDKGQGKVRQGLKFHEAVWFSELYIDLSDTTAFSGNQLEGVVYAFTTADWYLTARGSAKKKDFFEISEGIILPNQPLVQYRVESYMNPYCVNLRRQAAITGTANA